MKKTLIFILAAVLVLGSFCGCAGNGAAGNANSVSGSGTSNTEEVTVRVGTLKGPSSIGMVGLMEDAANNLTEGSYEFTMAGSPDEITPRLLKGELDICAVPSNLGAVLYNRSDGAVQQLAVSGLGQLYVLERGGNTITKMEDLKGRTIISHGKGSTPEFALRYLLEQNGLDPEKDVTIDWKSEAAQVVAELSTLENGIALLPQPFVTVAQMQLEDLSVALDLNEEWEKCDNGSFLVMTTLIVRKEFAEKYPKAVAQFLEAYEKSTEYVNENVEEAAILVEKYDIVKEPVAKLAIPYCNLVCVSGQEMQEPTGGYFQTLYDQSPEAIGGKMPEEDYYLVT